MVLKDAKQLAEKRDAASRVLATGDVASQVKPEQFDTAAQWLDELARACGYEETVAGSTLRVFNERRARKIPLPESDIPATEKANQEGGVLFQVPHSAR